MKSSIQWKIVGIYLSVVLVIMIASGSFIVYNIKEQNYELIEGKLEDSAQQIQTILSLEDSLEIDKDIEELTKRLRTVVALDKSMFIYILDEKGRVQIGTGDKSDQIITSEVVIDSMSNKKPCVTNWKSFSTRTQALIGAQEMQDKVLEYALPILDGVTGEINSIIYISASTEEVYQNIRYVMSAISAGTILAMGIAVVFSSIFSRMITEPIKQLTKSSKQLAGGSFNRIPIYSTDEIGQLTQSFNYMATELSRTMSDVTSEKNKLEKILENMADGVMAFNRQGVLIHANSICYEMLGVAFMDHRFDFIFAKLEVEISFDDILAGKVNYDEGVMLALEDKYFNIYLAPYANVLGESEGLVVVLQDITDQHKLDQMRKEFVANVSHELRTPLTTVKSYTETLLDGAIDDREIAVQFLGVMEKETDRMTQLVQDLLELSRIDNKQMQLDMRPVDMRQLIEETIVAQRIHAQKKSHKLTLEMDEEKDYFIFGDSARIRQILHNILSNAIKYSIDPGTITIKLFKNEEVVIQVQDTGIGIPKQDLGRVFERFYRVDKARSRNMGGTGLGLPIAKEMVELHGGRMKIASKVGKGTTVTLYFKALEEFEE
ncbi:MAG: ATP-binding protein [Cellulosilyticaceae bacterium]